MRLNVDVFRVCGGDFCIDSGGLEDGLVPGLLLEDGPGCGDCSEDAASWWWVPFGREVGNGFGLIGLDFWVEFCMPLVAGEVSSEDVVEGGESEEGLGVNPAIDAGLRLPFVFSPFNRASFVGVVDERVFLLEPRLSTLDGRDGGLTMGTAVVDKFLERRLDFSQSVRRRLRPTMGNRPCTPDMAPAVVGSDPLPNVVVVSGESRQRRCLAKFGISPHPISPPSEPKRCRRLASARLLSSPVCL